MRAYLSTYGRACCVATVWVCLKPLSSIHGALKICWQCLATKGMEGDASLQLAFTNVSLDAPYRATMFTTPPYASTPSYCSLLGYNDRMIAPDLLHVWNLGSGRDLAGSALVYMLKEHPHIFPGATLTIRLAAATSQLKAFARSRQLNLKLKKLSRSKLHMDSKSYPELRSNGYDTFIVLDFLQSVCETHHNVLPADLCRAIWSGNHVVGLLAKGGDFLSVDEHQNKLFFGQMFMRSYINLAHSALHQQKRLYRLRPKLHMLHHAFQSNAASRLNPNKFSTWLDEDCLRRLMKVLRMIDGRTAPTRLLERFLLALPGHWQTRTRGRK